MRNPFTALSRARDKPRDSVSTAPSFFFGTSGSGKSVNANTAIRSMPKWGTLRLNLQRYSGFRWRVEFR